MRGPLGFELFAINRQLWREAFPLFWRTSRIYFDSGCELERCLDRLTECQKTNLKHLALGVFLTSWDWSRPDDYDMIYRRMKRRWPSCDLKNAAPHPLRSLESLTLRLTLFNYRNSHACLLETIHAACRAFANLRFANFKEAQVTIEVKGGDSGESFPQKKLAEIAASYRSTLLDPTVTKITRNS